MRDFFKREYLLICAVVVGIIPRIYQLPGQLLAGDEWHAIHTALKKDYMGIFASFGSGEHSIPVSLYYKLAIDTVGLSEIEIRLPFLVAGIMTIFVLPLLIRPLFNQFTANLFAWFLALSPVLILYSRFARPYGIMMLAGFAAVTLFHSWWVTGNMRHATLYVALTTFAGYFMIVALPFILGPFLFFFIFVLLNRGEKRRYCIRRLSGMAIVTIIPLMLLLGPGLFTSFAALAQKTGHPGSPIGLETLKGAFWILTGSGNLITTIAMSLLILVALIRQYGTAHFFLIYLAALSMIQIVFVIITRPVAGGGSHIFARYILLVLPVLLLMAAVGMNSFFSTSVSLSGKWLKNCLATLLCLAVFFSGPIPSMRHHPNNAMSLSLFAHIVFGENSGKKLTRYLKRIPGFYYELATYPPGSLTIAEAPYHFAGDHIPFYQPIHRQNMIVGFINGLCSKSRSGEIPISTRGVSLNNYVFLKDFDSLRSKGVDFVIFHKRLKDEISYIPEYQHHDVSDCIKQFHLEFGPPVFEDQDIVVFLTGPLNGDARSKTPGKNADNKTNR